MPCRKVTPGKLHTTLIPEEMRTEENFEANRISRKNSDENRSRSSSSSVLSSNAVVSGNDDEDMGDVSSSTTRGSKFASLIESSAPKPFRERDESKTIFVGNLPFTVNEKILQNTVTKILGPNKVLRST